MAEGCGVFVTFFKVAEDYKVPCPQQTFSTGGDMQGPQARGIVSQQAIALIFLNLRETVY